MGRSDAVEPGVVQVSYMPHLDPVSPYRLAPDGERQLKTPPVKFASFMAENLDEINCHSHFTATYRRPFDLAILKKDCMNQLRIL